MDEFITTLHRVMTCVGIPIYAKRKWDSKPWLVYQIFNFILGFFCFVFTSVFLATNCYNFVVCIEPVGIWTTGFLMSMTLGVVLAFRRQFRAFLEELAFQDAIMNIPYVKHIFAAREGGAKTKELKSLVTDSQLKLLKYSRVFVLTYCVLTVTLASLYVCNTFYEIMMKEDESLRILAFEMWFPWSLDNYYVYVATFIYHVYAGFLVCMSYAGLQTTLVFLLGQVIRQLRIMRFIFLNLDLLIEELTDSRNERWQFYCTNVQVQCLQHFIKLKRFSNKLNVFCQPFYITLLSEAILVVCMYSVKIAISPLALETLRYMFHESLFILMVLMFSLFGQQVDNECEELETVVTEKWYIFNQSHKTSMFIIHMALCTRIPIYIFGSVTLSLPTFTWFLKTGMSVFTLLMSFLEEEN